MEKQYSRRLWNDLSPAPILGNREGERIQEYHPPDDRSGWTVPTDFWGIGVMVTILVTRGKLLSLNLMKNIVDEIFNILQP